MLTPQEVFVRAVRFAAGALLVLLTLLAALAFPAAHAQSGTAAAKPAPKPESAALVIEPRAIEVVTAASARLAAAKTMSFTAVASYESPSRLGPPLVVTTRSNVLLQRPDKLRVVTPGDGPASEFFYDGKSMVAYAPGPNLVAVAAAPPRIDAALRKAFDTAAIYFPFTDIVVADPWAALGDGLQAAFYIGRSGVVGGVPTDIVALANDEVFLQMWIGVEDKLPRRIRAQYKGDTLRLRHEVELSNWKLDAPIPPGSFTSAKALAAPRMAFANPNPIVPAGVKPIIEGAGDAAKAQSTK